MIRILTIGKKHKAWITAGLERYEKRLRAPWNVEWQLLPHSSRQGDQARREESERLLAKLKPTDCVILLDESGHSLTSEQLTAFTEQQFSLSHQPVFIIGGAYGVDETLMRRADLTLSLSKFVFPHQLVRLILIEQLYRADEISSGGSYHHA